MSENMIPPSTDRSRSFVVTITPAQPCFSCKRLSDRAMVTIDHVPHGEYNAIDTHIDISCPLHGYFGPDVPDGHTKQDALSSAARFVVWMHADRGKVVLVTSIEDLSAVPDYELYEGDIAWHCRYEAPDGVRIDSYVVYGIDDWHFYLYENGAQVTMREQERVAPAQEPTSSEQALPPTWIVDDNHYEPI